MKTNNSYKEAVLRAYFTEKDNIQDQERLLTPKQQTYNSATTKKLVVETHQNIMKSWYRLRDLDQRLAEDISNHKG